MTTHPPDSTPAAAKRRRNARGTHDRLVRAALELFTTRGYDRSTTPQIAERAGVAEGTIYRHFQSKSHLLNEIYRAAIRLLADPLSRRSSSASCEDTLAEIASSWQTLAARDPGLIRLVFSTPLGDTLDIRSRDAYGRLKEELAKVIASGKAVGAIRVGPVEVWTEVWLSLIVLALEKIASREWTRGQAAPELVVTAAWDAIKAVPETPQGARHEPA
ncbi:MAG: TetR/AcrR family transcriptional regulator [Gemmatimonadales bacterium]